MKDELFERLDIEHMVREYCADIHKRPPGPRFVDGLVNVLRLRLRRADLNHRDDSPGARGTLALIAEARGLDPDRPPDRTPLSPGYHADLGETKHHLLNIYAERLDGQRIHVGELTAEAARAWYDDARKVKRPRELRPA